MKIIGNVHFTLSTCKVVRKSSRVTWIKKITCDVDGKMDFLKKFTCHVDYRGITVIWTWERTYVTYIKQHQADVELIMQENVARSHHRKRAPKNYLSYLTRRTVTIRRWQLNALLTKQKKNNIDIMIIFLSKKFNIGNHINENEPLIMHYTTVLSVKNYQPAVQSIS